MADDDDDLDDVDIPETPAVESPDAAYLPGQSPSELRWPRSEGGRLDLKTWPHVAQVFFNRKAAEELIADLTRVLGVAAPTAGVMIEYRQHHSGGTIYQISTDDTNPITRPS